MLIRGKAKTAGGRINLYRRFPTTLDTVETITIPKTPAKKTMKSHSVGDVSTCIILVVVYRKASSRHVDPSTSYDIKNDH